MHVEAKQIGGQHPQRGELFNRGYAHSRVKAYGHCLGERARLKPSFELFECCRDVQPFINSHGFLQEFSGFAAAYVLALAIETPGGRAPRLSSLVRSLRSIIMLSQGVLTARAVLLNLFDSFTKFLHAFVLLFYLLP